MALVRGVGRRRRAAGRALYRCWRGGPLWRCNGRGRAHRGVGRGDHTEAPPPSAAARVSSRELDARPEADAGGPRFRTMERAWERGGCPSFGRIRLGGA